MGSNPEQEPAVSAIVSLPACFLIYLIPCVLVPLYTCLHPSSHVMTKDNTIRMTSMATAMMATRFRSV